MKIAEIIEEAREIEAYMDEIFEELGIDGAMDDSQERDLNMAKMRYSELEVDKEQKIMSIVGLVREAGFEAEKVKKFEEEARAHRKTAENKQTRLKEFLNWLLMTQGYAPELDEDGHYIKGQEGTKFNCAYGRLSWKRSASIEIKKINGVEITPEMAMKDEKFAFQSCVVTKPAEWSKTEIKKEIKLGNIPGFATQVHKATVTIKG